MSKVTSNKDMNKIEVSFPSSDPSSCQLYGDLYLPSSQNEESLLLPIIVIIAGSGPIDRNGNVPKPPMNLNTSNQFAEYMISSRSSKNRRSIAILSYDKRGVGKSINPNDKNFYNRAGMYDLVNGAVEAVRFAAQHPQIDRSKIILLGHSEGAILLPLICNEITKSSDLEPALGCIFYCGLGESIPEAMTLQRERVVNEVNEMSGISGWLLRRLITKKRLDKQYESMMTRVNAEDKPDFISMYCGLVKQPAKWIREHFEYDVHASLEKYITCHCLAITGMKDFQVRNEFCIQATAERLLPNAKSIEAHRPANLTHVLRSTDGEAKIMSAKKLYQKLGKLPLDEELLNITNAWCDRILF